MNLLNESIDVWEILPILPGGQTISAHNLIELSLSLLDLVRIAYCSFKEPLQRRCSRLRTRRKKFGQYNPSIDFCELLHLFGLEKKFEKAFWGSAILNPGGHAIVEYAPELKNAREHLSCLPSPGRKQVGQIVEQWNPICYPIPWFDICEHEVHEVLDGLWYLGFRVRETCSEAIELISM